MEAWSRYLLRNQEYYETLHELHDEEEARKNADAEYWAEKWVKGELE